MATTTNFGWTTPNDTDLVKDGAAAIRTLGQSIDTSLVDLKGGTTGQVLAKNSNTDMDFVWSADAAGMANPMTTTGDTIYSSSGSTPARLGIGSTGQVLTVAGGVPTWASPAGGFVGCSVFMSADVSLSNASLAAINFDSEYYDTNSMHDNVTNNSRITIPSGQGGKYLLTANIVYQNNATGVRYFFARINGGNNFFSGNNPAYAGTISSGFPTYVCNSFVLDLAANDYVELFSFQSSGGSLNLIGGDKGETFFQISKLG
jgi:hypothetical protein